jgi:hypothetical protein
MRIAKIIAAAALAVTGIAGATTATASPVTAVAAAAVQSYGYGYRDDRYRDDRRRDREDRWDRGHHRGWDEGRRYNSNRYYNNRSRRVCRTEWHRYSGRTTVCRYR